MFRGLPCPESLRSQEYASSQFRVRQLTSLGSWRSVPVGYVCLHRGACMWLTSGCQPFISRGVPSVCPEGKTLTDTEVLTVCSPGHLSGLHGFIPCINTPREFQNSSWTRTVPSISVYGRHPSQWLSQDLPAFRKSLQGLTFSPLCQEDLPPSTAKAVLRGEVCVLRE